MQDPTRWIIKRNCSATPGQLAAVFASIVAVSFVFGVAFAMQGLWMVLPFVGLELLAVALAFVCYGRHAADYERIELRPDAVEVERREAARSTTVTLKRPWAHVQVEQGRGPGLRGQMRLYIAASGERIEVGRHLPVERRAGLARELRQALR